MEKRVYLIAVGQVADHKTIEDFATPELWITEAERQGLVYSLDGFKRAFNNDEINCDDCFMQIY